MYIFETCWCSLCACVCGFLLQVPKKIGFFLVRQLQDKLQFELYNKLNDEQLFSSLLGEVCKQTRRLAP